MIENYKIVVFKNYANFSGRATRSEYWNYLLATIVISIILRIIDSILGFNFDFSFGLNFGNEKSGILRSIYSLLVFLPGLAVMVRRLHDVGKSGWFFFIVFTIIGIFWLLILLCTDSDDGTNQYGADPNDIFSDEIDEIGTSEA